MGRVYTISPLEGAGPEKDIHWTELRVAPASHTAEPVPASSSTEAEGAPTLEAVPSGHHNLGNTNTLASAVGSKTSTLSGSFIVSPGRPTVSRDPSPGPWSGQLSMALDPPPSPQGGQAQGGPKSQPTPTTMIHHTTRATAGLHSNPHHLPRSEPPLGVRDGPSGAAAHPVTEGAGLV